jgi:hypothetical protein
LENRYGRIGEVVVHEKNFFESFVEANNLKGVRRRREEREERRGERGEGGGERREERREERGVRR